MSFSSAYTAALRSIWGLVTKWVLGPGAAILVVLAGLGCLIFVGRLIPLGQLFEALVGKVKRPGEQEVLDVVNHPPPNRIADGKVIQPGAPDPKGLTQAVVVPIEMPGLFDRQDQVKYTPAGHDKPILVDLPTGVKASDVKAIVVVRPNVVAVTVDSRSGVTTSQVQDLLKKYSK